MRVRGATGEAILPPIYDLARIKAGTGRGMANFIDAHLRLISTGPLRRGYNMNKYETWLSQVNEHRPHPADIRLYVGAAIRIHGLGGIITINHYDPATGGFTVSPNSLFGWDVLGQYYNRLGQPSTRAPSCDVESVV